MFFCTCDESADDGKGRCATCSHPIDIAWEDGKTDWQASNKPSQQTEDLATQLCRIRQAGVQNGDVPLLFQHLQIISKRLDDLAEQCNVVLPDRYTEFYEED